MDYFIYQPLPCHIPQVFAFHAEHNQNVGVFSKAQPSQVSAKPLQIIRLVLLTHTSTLYFQRNSVQHNLTGSPTASEFLSLAYCTWFWQIPQHTAGTFLVLGHVCASIRHHGWLQHDASTPLLSMLPAAPPGKLSSSAAVWCHHAPLRSTLALFHPSISRNHSSALFPLHRGVMKFN